MSPGVGAAATPASRGGGEPGTLLAGGFAGARAGEAAPGTGPGADHGASAVELVRWVLLEAVRRGASDIHFEPYEAHFRVRVRIDGELHPLLFPPLSLRDAVTSRIKILAALDIAEKRLPQDGRIRLTAGTGPAAPEIDFRVSVLPTLFGEKVALRVLDRRRLPLDLDLLGLEPDPGARFAASLSQPHGMVLVTGPTGSGKTSTLYSCLARLHRPAAHIVTVEDPVEFPLPGVNQVQVRDQIGLTFAAALRSLLRQDPDIIMVGEIRDRDTAQVAFRAALTGHLVLSTLHTNDAPSGIVRLLDMGIEPDLAATSLHMLCAQRLVRRICSRCRKNDAVPVRTLAELGFDPAEAGRLQTFRGAGCSDCSDTGFRGRIGLFEVMSVSPTLRQQILDRAPAAALRRQARLEGMHTLRESGLHKIRQGITTPEEVVRETSDTG